MPLEILQKLEKLVSNGATIIGPKPLEVPGLQDYEKQNKQLEELTGKMWGSCNGTTQKINNYGKGKVVCGYTAQQWLERESVGPDFSCQNTETAGNLDYIHRRTEDSDIYFIRNKTTDRINADCIFRITNRTPQILDPTDGSIHDQFVYKKTDGRTILPLDLSAGGAVFVVFSEKTASSFSIASLHKLKNNHSFGFPMARILAVTKDTATIQCWKNEQYLLTNSRAGKESFEVRDLPAPIEINNNWTVEFDPDWGAPAEIKLPELISWTEHHNEGVKYYSGTGTYKRTFHIPSDWLDSRKRVLIDLGDVRELAEIFVNGHSTDILWQPPYQTEITSFVKPGKNELMIEVINLWINRLAGDKNLPDGKKFTSTNIRSDGATRYSEEEPWREKTAGLLGPVRLLPSVEVTVKSEGFFQS